MKKRTLLFTASLFVGAGYLATADHVSVGLSYLEGADVLTEIVYHTEVEAFGTPAIKLGREFGDGETMHVHDAMSFTVADGQGHSEVVTVEPFMFSNHHAVSFEEMMAVIDANTTLVDAYVDNNHVVIRGQAGGEGSTVTLTQGTGTALEMLGLDELTSAGSVDVEFAISAPDDHGDDHGDDDHGDDHGEDH